MGHAYTGSPLVTSVQFVVVYMGMLHACKRTIVVPSSTTGQATSQTSWQMPQNIGTNIVPLYRVDTAHGVIVTEPVLTQLHRGKLCEHGQLSLPATLSLSLGSKQGGSREPGVVLVRWRGRSMAWQEVDAGGGERGELASGGGEKSL